jgi:hypothetical protein
MRSNSVQMMQIVQFVKFNLQFHNCFHFSKSRGVFYYPVRCSAQTAPSSHTKRFPNGSNKDKLNSSIINNNNTAGRIII